MVAGSSYDPYNDRPLSEIEGRPRLSRISWGAVFAGVAVIWAVQFVLGLLGFGIGMTTIDPATGDTPQASTFGGVAAVWWVGVSLVSIFLGGLVAGRLSGAARKSDGMLHGFVAWCAATLILLYLMTSTASMLIGGAFRTVGHTLSVAGQTMASGARQAADSGAGEEAIEGIRRQGRELMGRISGAADPAAARPAAPLDEVYALVRRGPQAVSDVDRESAVRVLAQQTGRSEEEARATLDRWQKQYQEMAAAAERKARETAEQTAKALAKASLWAFFVLVLGAVCGSVGGTIGARRYVATY